MDRADAANPQLRPELEVLSAAFQQGQMHLQVHRTIQLKFMHILMTVVAIQPDCREEVDLSCP